MTIKNQTKNKIILKLFLDTNLALGYKQQDEHNLKVFLTAMPSPYKLKNFYRPTRPRVIKFKDLIRYKNKNTGSTYILSTPKGIITLKDAVKKKLGGILLFKIQ
jgi:ribosomal protein S8